MIQKAIAYLNAEYGYRLSSKYYEHVNFWADWWRGYHKPFHQFNDKSGGRVKTRELYTLKMAKTIAEDWAALLLNEDFNILCDHEGSARFIEDSMDAEGGVFGSSGFYKKANGLIERSFALGTGAFIQKVANLGVASSGRIIADKEAELFVDTVDARGIIPLTVKRGKITEAAFVTEVIERGKKLIYIELHRLSAAGYEIENIYLDAKGKRVVPPDGTLEFFCTESDIPLFAIMTPAQVNMIEGGMGMGMSVFANAIDNLKGVDLAFNNFLQDLKLGGKKVFYRGDLTKVNEHGQRVTPDDVAQQLFYEMGESMAETAGDPLKEYNPSLRVAENREAVQAQLDFLSFKCGLGTKRYRFDGSKIVTATEYVGDRQDLRQHIARHNLGLSQTLKDAFRAALFAAGAYKGADVDPEAKITLNLDDSFIEDKVSMRAQDMLDVREGIMAAWEFRVKWYGEDEETARAKIAEIQGGIDFEEI